MTSTSSPVAPGAVGPLETELVPEFALPDIGYRFWSEQVGEQSVCCEECRVGQLCSGKTTEGNTAVTRVPGNRRLSHGERANLRERDFRDSLGNSASAYSTGVPTARLLSVISQPPVIHLFPAVLTIRFSACPPRRLLLPASKIGRAHV